MNGVFLLTGESQCCSQPGWFRIVFTGQSDELDEGKKVILDYVCYGVKR